MPKQPDAQLDELDALLKIGYDRPKKRKKKKKEQDPMKDIKDASDKFDDDFEFSEPVMVTANV